MYRKTVDELEEDKRQKLIIDIRRGEDYERETYPDAVNIFWEEFEEHLKDIPKDRPVYLICYTGEKSDELAEGYMEKGYEIYSVEGG